LRRARDPLIPSCVFRQFGIGFEQKREAYFGRRIFSLVGVIIEAARRGAPLQPNDALNICPWRNPSRNCPDGFPLLFFFLSSFLCGYFQKKDDKKKKKERKRERERERERNVRGGGDVETVSAEGTEQGIGPLTERKERGEGGEGEGKERRELDRFLRHPVAVIDSSAKPGQARQAQQTRKPARRRNGKFAMQFVYRTMLRSSDQFSS